MKKNRLFALLSITVIFVFVTSLFSTVNVLADDNTPPVPTEEPVQPPSEGSTVEESPTEAPITEADPTSLPEVDLTETPEVDTPAEVLESVPEGVDVVVLDENGDAMPLVTEEAAQIIMSGDPIWCPDDLDGTPQDNPVAGANGCTVFETTFTDLLVHLSTGAYTGNGTIFVSYDYSAAEGQIYIDQTAAGLTGLGDLTIQGGWDFATGGMRNNDSTYQSSLANTWLVINNWQGNVTINNLFIDSSLFDGLSINTAGDVALDQVEVDNSSFSGAYIQSGGDVTITNSEFKYNGIDGVYDDYSDPVSYTEYYQASPGLWVSAAGNVTLNDVAAIENGGDGAMIFGTDVTIIDSIFEDNGWGFEGSGAYWEYEEFEGSGLYEYSDEVYGGDGLRIDASGDVTLEYVEVYGNAGDGADIEADGEINITDSTFSNNGGLGSLNISNYFLIGDSSGEADFDLWYEAGSGLLAEAGDDITLNGVIVSSNAYDGADLESESGDIEIIGSFFEYNGSGGTLFNCGCGYELMQNYVEEFCEFTDLASAPVPLFFNPCGDSEYIEVQGPFFEYDISFYAEEDSGVQVYYEIDQEGGTGLYVDADESVTLQNVYVNFNSGEGAYIDAGDGVEITNSVFYNNGYLGYLEVGECWGVGIQECVEMDGEPVEEAYAAYLGFEYGDGLHVDAGEDITLYNVNAMYNGNYGALLHSDDGSVFVETGEFSYNANRPIFIGGQDGLFGYFLYDQFGVEESLPIPASEFDMGVELYEGMDEAGFDIEIDLESGDGLEVYADSNITLTDVAAMINGGNGASLFANEINISESDFQDNGFGLDGYMLYGTFYEDEYEGANVETNMSNGNGLYIGDSGAVTLNNVSANGNALYGAEIYSDSNVFVEESEFSGNGHYGYGTYEYSYYFGYYDSGLGEFVIIGEEDASGEWYGSGLYIETGGNVTLKDVDANTNYLNGAEIYTDGGSIEVICGHYSINGEYGIYAEDASSLELSGPEIIWNGTSPDEYFFSGDVILTDNPDCADPIPPTVEKTKKIAGPVVSICDGRDTAAFVLPNGDFVVFPCPINDQAFVQPVVQKDLPGKLDEALKFLSALKTDLIRDGASVEELEKSVVVSFILPEGVDAETLSIMFWNGEEWTDLGGEVSDDGLYFEVSTQMVGTFVLVSK